MNPLVEAALSYAACGISVVPLHNPVAGGCSCPKGSGCSSAGKHPRLDWKPYQEHRAPIEEIRAWWDRWPAANVAIVTGMISRLCVLDIDHRNGGFESLVELDHHGAAMPDDNPVVVTGSGGSTTTSSSISPAVRWCPRGSSLGFADPLIRTFSGLVRAA